MDGTHDSLVTVANGSNQPALAQLTILYNQGTGQYQVEKTLAPGQQMALDFGELIREAVPDKSGHTLPPGLTSGTYHLLDLNNNPMGSLYEGKEIVDKTWGHTTYTCMICCGPNNPSMKFDPLDLQLEGFDNQVVQAVNSCTGKLTIITNDYPTWWTNDTTIATANGSQITGVGVGSTYHNAQSIYMYMGPRADSGGSECPGSQDEEAAGTNVVGPPDHLVVVVDQQGVPASCPSTGIQLRQCK